MNNEYARLLDLVFPSENPEMKEFRIVFEEYEAQDKINSIATNQEHLHNYIGQLESHREDEDDYNSMYNAIIKLSNNHPKLTKVKEFIENDEWHLIVDYLDEQEQHLASMDFEKHIKQRNLRQELEAYHGMNNNMENLKSYILENML